jgi:hypothetical protein
MLLTTSFVVNPFLSRKLIAELKFLITFLRENEGLAGSYAQWRHRLIV